MSTNDIIYLKPPPPISDDGCCTPNAREPRLCQGPKSKSDRLHNRTMDGGTHCGDCDVKFCETCVEDLRGDTQRDHIDDDDDDDEKSTS